MINIGTKSDAKHIKNYHFQINKTKAQKFHIVPQVTITNDCRHIITAY